jgi:hypothetical protein
MLLAGFSAAVGIVYFCVDVYRNRNKRSPGIDETAGFGSAVDGLSIADMPEVNRLTAQVSHAASESGHNISHGIGHVVNAIVHAVSHH